MKMKELKDAGELLAKACAAYHKTVADKTKCEPEELTSQLKINDDDHLYKIVITAELFDDDND